MDRSPPPGMHLLFVCALVRYLPSLLPLPTQGCFHLTLLVDYPHLSVASSSRPLLLPPRHLISLGMRNDFLAPPSPSKGEKANGSSAGDEREDERALLTSLKRTSRHLHCQYLFKTIFFFNKIWQRGVCHLTPLLKHAVLSA